MTDPDGSYTEFDPDWPDDDPRLQDPATPPEPAAEQAVEPYRGGPPATRQGPTTTVADDNVFDFDEEIKPVVLRGRIAQMIGLEPDTVMNEPSQKAVRDFRRMFWEVGRAARPDRNMPDNPTDEQIDDLIASRDWGEQVSGMETDAFAVLCGATPPPTHRPTPPVRPERPPEPTRGEQTTDQQHAAAMGRHKRKLEQHAEQVAEWDEAIRKHTAAVDEWEAAWRGGIPSRQQLDQLPYRGKVKFFGYLIGKFADPFGGSAGSTG